MVIVVRSANDIGLSFDLMLFSISSFKFLSVRLQKALDTLLTRDNPRTGSHLPVFREVETRNLPLTLPSQALLIHPFRSSAIHLSTLLPPRLVRPSLPVNSPLMMVWRNLSANSARLFLPFWPDLPRVRPISPQSVLILSEKSLPLDLVLIASSSFSSASLDSLLLLEACRATLSFKCHSHGSI